MKLVLKDNNRFFVIVVWMVVIYVGIVVKKGFFGRYFVIILVDFVLDVDNFKVFFDVKKLKVNVKLYIGKGIKINMVFLIKLINKIIY